MFDFPNSPTANQIITGPNGATWQWDGVKWRANAVWQGATVITSDTPPVNPPTGALWWDSLGGQLYVNYADPNSVEWVIANTGGIPDAPADGNTYARSNQQWVAITGAVAAAPNNTGRNLIHNGQFNVQQRGAGPWTVSGGYTADRWMFQLGGSDTLSASIVTLADADRAAIGDESAKYALQAVFAGSATANSYSNTLQRIEDVRRLSARSVTASFWARATSGTPRIGVVCQQTFGTGGSPSGQVIVPIGTTAALTSTWTRYSISVALPSVAGKTLGTNNDSSNQFGFWLSDVSNVVSTGIGQQSGTVQFYGVQLEIGSVMTPLAKRDPADELALCQRFYQTGGNGAMSLQGYTQSGVGVGVTGLWPVQFRTVPTLTINWSNAGAVTSPSFTATTSSWFIGGSGSGSGGFILNSSGFTASADL